MCVKGLGTVLRITLKIMKRQIKKTLFPDNYKYPTGVQLELIYKCNHRCIHCYNKSGGAHEEKELNIEQWKAIAERLGELGIFQCVISGGEPTLLGDDLQENRGLIQVKKHELYL